MSSRTCLFSLTSLLSSLCLILPLKTAFVQARWYPQGNNTQESVLCPLLAACGGAGCSPGHAGALPSPGLLRPHCSRGSRPGCGSDGCCVARTQTHSLSPALLWSLHALTWLPPQCQPCPRPRRGQAGPACSVGGLCHPHAPPAGSPVGSAFTAPWEPHRSHRPRASVQATSTL